MINTTEIIKQVWVQGRPTEGELAVKVWELSATRLEPQSAVSFMEQCGYVPFQGYPLRRSARQVPPTFVR